jgi:hypothetical protein
VCRQEPVPLCDARIDSMLTGIARLLLSMLDSMRDTSAFQAEYRHPLLSEGERGVAAATAPGAGGYRL